MSMRTVCEFNHDYSHNIERNQAEFMALLKMILSGGRQEDKERMEIKFGLSMAETAHHSDTREYHRNGRVARKF